MGQNKQTTSQHEEADTGERKRKNSGNFFASSFRERKKAKPTTMTSRTRNITTEIKQGKEAKERERLFGGVSGRERNAHACNKQVSNNRSEEAKKLRHIRKKNGKYKTSQTSGETRQAYYRAWRTTTSRGA